jgi:hypothetical protein
MTPSRSGFASVRSQTARSNHKSIKKSGSVSRVLYPADNGGRRSFILTNRCRLALPYGKRPTRRHERLLTARTRAECPAAWSCRRWGLPCRRRHRRRGALLPHHFTITCPRGDIGCVFSVALSRGSPRVAVSHHRALSCSDFPPASKETGDRPTHSL